MVRTWQDLIGYPFKVIIGALLANDKMKVGVRHRLVLHHGGGHDRQGEIFAISWVVILRLVILPRDAFERRLGIPSMSLFNLFLQALIMHNCLLLHKPVHFHALPTEITAQRRTFR